MGCWVLILGTFYKLSWPIYKPDGHLKPDGFGSELSPVSVGLISHPGQFYCGSGFCSIDLNPTYCHP
jgi:hypothetical protein